MATPMMTDGVFMELSKLGNGRRVWVVGKSVVRTLWSSLVGGPGCVLVRLQKWDYPIALGNRDQSDSRMTEVKSLTYYGINL